MKHSDAAADGFAAAHVSQTRLSAAVVTTTAVTQELIDRHQLNQVAALALSRLASATALLHLLSGRIGTLSLQVISKGPLRQLFADIDHEGRMRGYCIGKAPPVIPQAGRITVAAAVGEGALSALRHPAPEGFSHSTTELITGEIDQDIEHFCRQSEQIPSFLLCDAVFDDAGVLMRAGGLLVQDLPDTRSDALEAVRDRCTPEAFLRTLRACDAPAPLLQALIPDSSAPTRQLPIAWHCRCSRERVLGALLTLGQAELQDMIDSREEPQIDCDFCQKHYQVTTAELLSLTAVN
ncbi:Hsp33 family molecular chaperone HslO [Novosphingobium sp.]|uniref:Hsp33 family molecular chaperone HslO n=1 Tax=Novosphingobium sp. TaxID=1874826 RepID=UPI003D0B4872